MKQRLAARRAVPLVAQASLLLSFLAPARGEETVARSPAPVDASSAAFASFAHEVVPLLRRQGCSSAYCHGSATGRGGLKLSLFGSDPAADHRAIVEELDGRRIDRSAPAESLLLAKATRSLAHGGGRRIEEASAEHARILRWIESGALPASTERDRLVGLDLERSPDGVRAVARFRSATGTTRRDVTTLAVFSSTDETVARVDAKGQVKVLSAGEAWILASYAQTHARVSVVTAFSTSPAPEVSSESGEKRSPIDGPWLERLRELGLPAAPAASPETLARRLHLDLLARGPSLAELDAFLALPEASRVEQTARALLETREFAEVFAAHLAEWLEVPRPDESARPNGSRDIALREQLFEFVANDRPLPELVEAALGEGPLGMLVRRFGDARDRAEFVGRAFLGIRLGCARCHNHPLDRWTQSDHLGFSAYFTDPRPAAEGGTEEGRLFHPRSGEVVEPRLLPPGIAAEADASSRSRTLTSFVLDREHRLFARSMVNRVLAALLGRGLVEPLDDHRLSNPAVHEPVLESLTAHFVARDMNLRELVLDIVSSRLWALSSEPGSTTRLAGDREATLLARRIARPLDAITLERSLRFAIGSPPLPSPLGSTGLSHAPLARELALLNGPLIHEALRQPGTHLDLLVEFSASPRETLEELWRLTLSRSPRPEEVEAFLPLLSENRDPRAAVRDLALALLSSREAASLR